MTNDLSGIKFERFKKLLYKFIDKRYAPTELIKIGTYWVLVDEENHDDYAFEISLRGNLTFYDNLAEDVNKFFNVDKNILTQIVKDWVKDTYDLDVKFVWF